MVSPIVSLYVAMASRTAAVTPSPSAPRIERPIPGRPSPNPIRPAHGFHFRHPGSGNYGPDGSDTSAGLLIVVCVGAVVVALAAWLFLLWRQKRRPSAYASPHGHPPYPEAPRWDR